MNPGKSSIITVILAGILCLASHSQNKVINLSTYDYSKYHFGFILAVNQMHFTIRPETNLYNRYFDSTYVQDFSADSAMLYSIEHTPTIGFTVGIVSNLRLGEYFDLRFIPSLSFGERNLNYTIMKFRGGAPSLIDISKNIPSTYVDFPFQVKYKSKRLDNFRPYLITGINYRFDLASQFKKKREQTQVQIKLKRSDVDYEAGVGFDYYFEWFKLGTELKMSYGIFDILKREKNIYTDGIDKLSSKIFQLSFTFE